MNEEEIQKIKAEARSENSRKAGNESGKNMTPEARSERGKNAANARWKQWRESNL